MPTNITADDIQQAQQQWADGVVAIGQAFVQQQDYKSLAKSIIHTCYAYAYDTGTVLFKPTMAKRIPFRKTAESALAYFIGNNPNFPEDKGFALRPWEKVTFDNHNIFFRQDIAIAMGQYHFHAFDNKILTAEFTFGYIKDEQGSLKIILQHSSLPYDAD